MDIIEVNGKKYIRKTTISEALSPMTSSKAIDIIKPINPTFVCDGQCDKCKKNGKDVKKKL